MAQKTIYLPESAVATWDDAKEKLGESMGSIVNDCLERKLAEALAIKEMDANGFDRIVIDVLDDADRDRVRQKSFKGYWLFEGLQPLNDGDGVFWAGSMTFSVARTAKGSLAVYIRDDKNDGGDLDVFETFEEFRDHQSDNIPFAPQNIISAVAAELAVEHIEDIDI